MARHPNVSELTDWLDGAAPHLDEHVGRCTRCAKHIDRIGAPDADLRRALLSVLEPPPDLESRISARIAARLQDRKDAELFAALLGIPFEAGRIVLEPPEPE